MSDFVSRVTNKLDSKGRVSIPAAFRAVLDYEEAKFLYCCPTLDMQAIDAGGSRFQGAIRDRLAQFETFSEDHEFLSTALLGESENLKIDTDGRVTLSDALKEHAGITTHVTFVGQGYKFQIWAPERFETYRNEAKIRVRELRRRLGATSSGSPNSGADT
ncbi:division/cell wall cluster transcriptional repressor MraZ [Coralliovum pocilloporae]|uniref:division/cell wall cluster transcriptional repressor MraZ n=1 Tax=Coralliovum pocilloporae TaxID=3066369 RepID=UPI00330712E4